MKLKAKLIVGALCISSVSCTVVDVKRADQSLQLTHLCIQENSSVIVPNFVSVLRNGISRNGLTSEVFSGQKPANCDFVLTYTAKQSWDFKPYLAYAELHLGRNGQEIASAQYRLRRGLFSAGGLSLTKWASVESKMDPVIDELLANHRRPVSVSSIAVATPSSQPAPATMAEQPDSPVSTTSSAALADHAVPASDGFQYSGSPESAARALATSRNCSNGFRLYSSEESRTVYSSTCWGTKKLLIACESGVCREMR